MGLLNGVAEELLKFLLSPKDNEWIEWMAQENEWQDDCDKFNGCYFAVKNMPIHPQHLNCRCRLKEIAKPMPNNGGIQRIKTGWSLLPKGEIKMATPFSGFAN